MKAPQKPAVSNEQKDAFFNDSVMAGNSPGVGLAGYCRQQYAGFPVMPGTFRQVPFRCWKHAVADLCSQAEIPPAIRHSAASVDGIFHQVPAELQIIFSDTAKLVQYIFCPKYHRMKKSFLS